MIIIEIELSKHSENTNEEGRFGICGFLLVIPMNILGSLKYDSIRIFRKIKMKEKNRNMA